MTDIVTKSLFGFGRPSHGDGLNVRRAELGLRRKLLLRGIEP
jgi:hypothetical protein